MGAMIDAPAPVVFLRPSPDVKLSDRPNPVKGKYADIEQKYYARIVPDALWQRSRPH
ncbi:MAG: hypothetical protein ACM32K_03125 [Syntrophaceae bacterium]